MFPDDNIITDGAKRIRCVEMLFQPASRAADFATPLFITKCDVDICKNLHAVVVFSGSTTIFLQGFGEHRISSQTNIITLALDVSIASKY